MKNLTLLILALFLSLSSYSQKKAVTDIQKNVNEQAAGLEQSLNFALDTLTLKSDKNILRVTFLSHDEKDSVIIDVDAPEIKIPLYHFKKGRYTIAVYREDKIIALGVKRVDDIARPENAIADLEESILRSSLSEKEQVARNIKPLKKKPRVTKEKDTRVAVAKPRVTRKKATPNKQPVKTRKQREPRVVSNVNKKNVFEIAAEREEAKKAARLKNEKDRAVAKNTRVVNKPTRASTMIVVKKVTYNLSNENNKNIEKETRAEYREKNLRPNGTRYNN
ncbi:hypothetical protein [Lacinutrix sp.]|uniref:hypothetical protein n=1 Tax=Lacinutrix sp. TaxID=1937692 RepID=UPI0025BB4C2F|nr:hypothetical protein [Lacinutrix sp.]